MIYLDSAATTRVLEPAAQAAYTCMTEEFFNPSAQYAKGSQAHARMDECRKTIAKALSAAPEQIVFTASGTEADNLAIQSAIYVNRHKKTKHIVTTQIEHAAVREQMLRLQQEGYDVTFLKPNRMGEITAQQMEEAITAETILVSLMRVNNELGTVIPVEAAARAIAATGAPALLHTDAVQAFCKMPFAPSQLGVDYAAISAHKIGAPKGVGALYCRDVKKLLRAQVLGGGQEHGARSGTENIPGIAAFAAAAQIRQAHLQEDCAHMCALRDEILRRAEEMDGVEVLARGEAPHIVTLSLVGYPAENTVRFLGDAPYEVCISKGSACHKGKASHVFSALNRPPKVTEGALRVSLCPESTRQEVDALFAALTAARESLAHH